MHNIEINIILCLIHLLLFSSDVNIQNIKETTFRYLLFDALLLLFAVVVYGLEIIFNLKSNC